MKKTLLDMMDNAASTWPTEPYALRKTDKGYVASSFLEVRDKARAFAAWLLLSGVGPVD
jgi:long-subunit acyl-CoA synthetase (AMP-forming)